MKKIILSLVAVIIFAGSAFADELRLDKEIQYQKKVMETGYRILNANKIDKRMTFGYSTKNIVNASTYGSSKKIFVYKGLIPYFDDENEMAAVLSHEISHGLDMHAGFWRRAAMKVKSRKYETKADKKAVDLMVNAGYNPVALIVVLNKIAAEPSWFEPHHSHPVGSKRLADVYEYIYVKYPAYIADNDYKNNLYYQNFLLTSKNSREVIRQKYSEKNVVPVNNKRKK